MIYYSDLYSALTLPERHRFPIAKYRKIYERLQSTSLARYLVNQQTTIAIESIKACHAPDYVESFVHGRLNVQEIKKMGFPWSSLLVERTLCSLGNTQHAAIQALTSGWAINLSGGYHHAHADFGAGYCIFNDFAVIANLLIAQGFVDNVLIFDCDVHQGDGTARICQDRPDVITVSIHCQQNFPKLKAQSDMDFALPPKTNDAAYLTTVKDALDLAIRLYQPDIVLYNAGADIYQKDELGLFDVSLTGIKQRDSVVLSTCFQKKLPVVAALGGGYIRDEEKLIEAHLQLFWALLDNL